MRYSWPRYVAGLFLVALVIVCFFQMDVQNAVATTDNNAVTAVLADTDVERSVETCEAEVMTPDRGVEISEVVLYTRVVSELVKTFYIA